MSIGPGVCSSAAGAAIANWFQCVGPGGLLALDASWFLLFAHRRNRNDHASFAPAAEVILVLRVVDV